MVSKTRLMRRNLPDATRLVKLWLKPSETMAGRGVGVGGGVIVGGFDAAISSVEGAVRVNSGVFDGVVEPVVVIVTVRVSDGVVEGVVVEEGRPTG